MFLNSAVSNLFALPTAAWKVNLLWDVFWCVRAEEPDSPTYRVINEIYRTEHHRTLMVIPAYVFHAHHNVGQTEALFISMPTRIYHHESPDVYRLPLDNNTIPYRFEQRMGW